MVQAPTPPAGNGTPAAGGGGLPPPPGGSVGGDNGAVTRSEFRSNDPMFAVAGASCAINNVQRMQGGNPRGASGNTQLRGRASVSPPVFLQANNGNDVGAARRPRVPTPPSQIARVSQGGDVVGRNQAISNVQAMPVAALGTSRRATASPQPAQVGGRGRVGGDGGGGPPPPLPQGQPPFPQVPAHVNIPFCRDGHCETCLVIRDPTRAPRRICCPVDKCDQHGKIFYDAPGSGGEPFKWGGLEPLRKHIQVAHPKVALVHLGNRFMFNFYRLLYCSKPNCGCIAFAQSNTAASRIPKNPQDDSAWDVLIASKHDCGGVPNPTYRRPVDLQQAPARANNPHGVGGPNGALLPWLAEAMVVVSGITSIGSLPPAPPILAELPTRSTSGRDTYSSIIRGIAVGLATPNLSVADSANIWKVFLLLPRFLAGAPVVADDGGEVYSVEGFVRKCIVLTQPGGPRVLWLEHIRASEIGLSRRLNSTRSPIDFSDDEFAHAQQERAQRCIDKGDVNRGYKHLTSDFAGRQLGTDEAFQLLRSTYSYDNGDLDELFEYSNHALEAAVAEGKLQPGELEVRLTESLIWRAVCRATPIEGADETGWRPYHLKQMLHPQQRVLDGPAQENLRFMLNLIATGKVPRPVWELVYGWQFAALQHRVTRKDRVLNAPYTLAKVAFSAEALLSKPVIRGHLEPTQVAFGTPGGTDVMAHIDKMMAEYAPREWMAVKYDFAKWYYKANRMAIARAMVRHGMFAQLQSFVAAFGGQGKGRISYRNREGQCVVFPACTNGLPPGHPLSGSACAIPTVDAWNEAVSRVGLELVREAGSPPMGSPQFNSVISEYRDNITQVSFVDDGMVYGHPDLVPRTMAVFADINELQGSGKFSQEKTRITMLNGGDVPLEVQIAVSVAMATRAQKCAHDANVSHVMQAQAQVGLSGPFLPARLVRPDFPLATAVRQTSIGDARVDYAQDVSLGGISVVGACRGTPEYMSYQAEVKGEEVIKELSKVTAYSHLQGQFFFLRVCTSSVLTSLARVQGGQQAFVDGVYNPYDRAVEAQMARILDEPALTDLQRDLLRLPLRKSGAGLRAIGPIANCGAWLGAHLNAAKFIDESYPRTHILSRILDVVQGVRPPADPYGRQAEYGEQLFSAVVQYRGLFESKMQRPHDPGADGFEMSPRGLMSKSVKFQAHVAALQADAVSRSIRPKMSAEQAAGYKAQCRPGTAAVFTAIPVKASPVFCTDQVFKYIAARRFLKQSIGALGSESRKCRIGTCKERLTFNHLESCICTNIQHMRHEAMRVVTQDLLKSINVQFDQADLRDHAGIRNELAQAGVVSASSGALVQYAGPGRRRGNNEGADMLIHNLNHVGERLAVDFTAVSDRAACRVTPSLAPTASGLTNAQEAATLAGAEEIKRNRYGRVYDPIGIQIEGIAIDLAGDIGPGFRQFLKRCEVIGEGQLPEWANWSSGSTFFAAWRQRYVAVVQIRNAELALRNRARSAGANAAWEARANGG